MNIKPKYTGLLLARSVTANSLEKDAPSAHTQPILEPMPWEVKQSLGFRLYLPP